MVLLVSIYIFAFTTLYFQSNSHFIKKNSILYNRPNLFNLSGSKALYNENIIKTCSGSFIINTFYT